MAQLRFINLGYGYGVCANRVVMILKARTKQGYAIRARAKEEGKFISCTAHRPMNTIFVLDNDFVIGCAFSSETLIKRLRSATEAEDPYKISARFQGIAGNAAEEETDEDESDEEEEMENMNMDDDSEDEIEGDDSESD